MRIEIAPEHVPALLDTLNGYPPTKGFGYWVASVEGDVLALTIRDVVLLISEGEIPGGDFSATYMAAADPPEYTAAITAARASHES